MSDSQKLSTVFFCSFSWFSINAIDLIFTNQNCGRLVFFLKREVFLFFTFSRSAHYFFYKTLIRVCNIQRTVGMNMVFVILIAMKVDLKNVSVRSKLLVIFGEAFSLSFFLRILFSSSSYTARRRSSFTFNGLRAFLSHFCSSHRDIFIIYIYVDIFLIDWVFTYTFIMVNLLICGLSNQCAVKLEKSCTTEADEQQQQSENHAREHFFLFIIRLAQFVSVFFDLSTSLPFLVSFNFSFV